MSNVRSNVRGLLSWYEHVLQALSVDDDDDDDDDCVQRVRPAAAKLKVHVEEERNNEDGTQRRWGRLRYCRARNGTSKNWRNMTTLVFRDSRPASRK